MALLDNILNFFKGKNPDSLTNEDKSALGKIISETSEKPKEEVKAPAAPTVATLPKVEESKKENDQSNEASALNSLIEKQNQIIEQLTNQVKSITSKVESDSQRLLDEKVNTLMKIAIEKGKIPPNNKDEFSKWEARLKKDFAEWSDALNLLPEKKFKEEKQNQQINNQTIPAKIDTRADLINKANDYFNLNKGD